MNKIHKALEPLAVDIDSVKLDPKNARIKHDVEGIAASLDEYHQRKPIVVNARTKEIEAGNGTWKAAKHLGWDKIATVMVYEDKKSATGFSLADNLLTDKSVFDVDILKNLLEDFDDPFDIPGVSADWLEGLGVGDGLPDDTELDDPDDESQNDSEMEIIFCPKCGFEFERKKT